MTLAFRVQGENINTLVVDCACIHARVGSEQVDECGGEGGFSATAFTDNANHFATMGFKIGSPQSLYLADTGIITD